LTALSENSKCHCYLRIEPQEQGKGYEFVNEIRGTAIPREFIPAIQKGVVEAMENGVIAGYPLVDMKVAVYDGSYHDVDSSEIAFKIAASEALQKAVKQAQPAILEPVMKVEVSTPEEYMGEVIGDLSAKRAAIQGSQNRGRLVIINAEVPLAEMSGYVTRLRGLTKGRAFFYMEFAHYAELPTNLREELIDSHQSPSEK
jgi:elongation factor G